MTTQYGWTFNGHHYTECESTRLGRPWFSFHRDGVKLTEKEWRLLMKEDRAVIKPTNT